MTVSSIGPFPTVPYKNICEWEEANGTKIGVDRGEDTALTVGDETVFLDDDGVLVLVKFLLRSIKTGDAHYGVKAAYDLISDRCDPGW